jgi:hypothetical protein
MSTEQRFSAPFGAPTRGRQFTKTEVRTEKSSFNGQANAERDVQQGLTRGRGRGADGQNQGRGRGGFATKKIDPVRAIEHITRVSDSCFPEGKFEYFHHCWEFKEQNRDVVAQTFQSFLDEYATHKDKTTLHQKIVEYATDVATLSRRRITVLSTQYLVAIGGFHDVLQQHPILSCVLKGCLAFDMKCQAQKYSYLYTIKNLTLGDIPDSRHPELFKAFREIFDFDKVTGGTQKLLDDFESDVLEILEKEESAKVATAETTQAQVPAFGTATQPTKQAPASRFALASGHDWGRRLPMTFADCLGVAQDFLSKGGKIDSCKDMFEGTLVVQNSHAWYQLFFTILQPPETIFKIQKKTMKEKKEIIEKNLHYIVESIHMIGTPLEPTASQAKEMIRWLIKNLSYHPLGAFDSKHFPLCEKLNEIAHDTTTSVQSQNLAKTMVEEIKTFDLKKITTHFRLQADFYKRELNYGILGFAGLHQHCFNMISGEYKNSIFELVEEAKELPILMKTLMSLHAKEVKTLSDSKFFLQFTENIMNKKKEFEASLVEKKRHSSNLRKEAVTLREQLDGKRRTSPEIKAKSEEIEVINSEIDAIETKISVLDDALTEISQAVLPLTIDYVGRFFSGVLEVDDIKSQYVSDLMKVVSKLCSYTTLGPIFEEKFLAICKENIKKFNKKNPRVVAFLETEFVSHVEHYSESCLAKASAQVETIKAKLVGRFLEDIAITLSTFDGEELEQETISDNESEIFQGLLNYIRSDIKATTEAFHEIKAKVVADQDQDALFMLEKKLRDYPEKKKHLLENLRSRKQWSTPVARIDQFLADVRSGTISTL